MPLPPDRSHLLTEQRNPRSMSLHTLSAAECVALINREDRTVLDAIEKAGPALTALIQAAEPGFTADGRLIYVGAGTSGRLGVLDASEAPPTFQVEPGKVVGLIAGGDSALRKSSEGKEDDPDGARPELDALNLTPRDTVIGIAAGGTTPYVLGALRLAKARPAPPLTALIACSPVPRPSGADHLIILETGPEVLTGSTRMKAGTATKLALNTISTTLMVRSGRVYQNLMVDLRATNAKLRDRAARIVATLTGLPRDDAFALLDDAGGAVKTAIVMHRRGIPRAEAEALLTRTGQRLDAALDTPLHGPA
ncbi:MAG: N-acetylmuramic acid 6-phosphate etherase [Phycisphaerales bacterium]|nr:N-acetylmuramic acid 6-phosphate etherase [Phycisphaerales bacterium]